MPSIISKEQMGGMIRDFAQPISMPLFQFLWAWLRSMVWMFLLFLVLLSLLLTAYGYFQGRRDRSIQFLVGPLGTAGPEEAALLENEVRKHHGFIGPNYS